MDYFTSNLGLDSQTFADDRHMTVEDNNQMILELFEEVPDRSRLFLLGNILINVNSPAAQELSDLLETKNLTTYIYPGPQDPMYPGRGRDSRRNYRLRGAVTRMADLMTIADTEFLVTHHNYGTSQFSFQDLGKPLIFGGGVRLTSPTLKIGVALDSLGRMLSKADIDQMVRSAKAA